MPHGKLTSPEVLPLRENDERHAGEWAVIKILDPSGPRGDVGGVVLAHGPSRKKMSKALYKARTREPSALLTVMLCGGRFGDGEALRRALARIAAEEEFVSVNAW